MSERLPNRANFQRDGRYCRRSNASLSNGKAEENVASQNGDADVNNTPKSNSPSDGVLRRMAEMWRKKQLNDVVLAVGKHRFGAHKLVLSACSGYFHKIFADGTEENGDDQFVYNLHGISHRSIELLLESMYTTQLKIHVDNLEELLRASVYLEMPHAVQICCQHMMLNLTPKSCITILTLVSNFELNELQEAAGKMAARHFKTVSKSEDFRRIPPEQLKKFLCRDDIEVDSELEVFQSFVSWILYDKERRICYSVMLLECIRLPMIKPVDLVDHVETVTFLMRIPECEALVKEALHYHCLPLRQSILQSTRTTPRSTIKLATIVVIGGHPRLSKDEVNSEVTYYNPQTKEWRLLTRMIHPLHHHAVAVLGGFLYVAGGRKTTNRSEIPTDTAYRYDPRTDSWIQISSMKNKRESFQLGVLDGMLYAVGGRVDDDTSLADVERYNPLIDQWQAVAPLSDARRSVAVAAHGGRLYGMGGSGNRRMSNKVERYNPKTNKWETKRPMATPRFFALLVSVKAKLYFVGGATVDSSGNLLCVPSVDQYDPMTDTWSNLTPMFEPRAEAACTVNDGKIFIVGGYSWDYNTWLNSVECYNVSCDEWTYTESMPKAYTGMGCCTLTLHKLP